MEQQTISDAKSTVASARGLRTFVGQGADLPELTAEVVQAEGAAAQQAEAGSHMTIWVFRAAQEPRRAELAGLVADDANFIWVDLSGYAQQDLCEVVRWLGLHESGSGGCRF